MQRMVELIDLLNQKEGAGSDSEKERRWKREEKRETYFVPRLRTRQLVWSASLVAAGKCS